MNTKRITRLLIALIIIAVTFTSLSVNTFADNAYSTGYINGSVVNLRSEPNTDCEILGKYVYGDVVYVVSQSDGWSKVMYYDSYGYVASEYITIGNTPKNSPAKVNYPSQYSFIEEHAYNGSAAGAAVILEAANYLGTPYVYGGAKPGGFDCSGFVYYVYKQLGYKIGRTTYDQMDDGIAVSRENLQPGDIVGFSSGGGWSHVGLYVGEGKFIHSPRTGKTICLESLDSSYYGPRYAGARRIVE